MQDALHRTGGHVPSGSPAQAAKRRLRLIELLADSPCTAEEMIARLTPRAARRTVLDDLRWVRDSFPDRIVRSRAAGGHGTGRVAYAWQGAVPHLLAAPISFLTEEELVALVAARGLLRDVHPLDRTDDRPHAQDDHLAAAITRMLARAGLRERASTLARHMVMINRFGTEPLQPGVLQTCLTATSLGEALNLTYAGLYGDAKPTHIAPKRMMLIKGEWYCLAWRRGHLRTFRLSRMTEVTRTRTMPKGHPTHIPAEDLDREYAAAFYATSGQERVRVTLAVSPETWPHVRNRRWGEGMQVDQDLKKLPKGWHRISFVTSGISDCAYWVLSLGSGIRVDSPKDLRTWIRAEAKLMGA